MKLDQDDVIRICKRVVDHVIDTQFVADQFEISRRRVQQLAKEYRDTGEIPTLDTPGRDPYAEYPSDLEERILEIHHSTISGRKPSQTSCAFETASLSIPIAFTQSWKRTTT